MNEVTATVRAAGGSVLFVGPEANTNPQRWYALVEVSRVGDADSMWRNIGTKGPVKRFS